jgi:periplasmic protein TonB
VNAQTRAYGISVGIHALVFSSVLLVGLITPRTRSVVLDFSINSSLKTGQEAAAPVKRQVSSAHEQRTVTPTAQIEDAVSIKKEQTEELPQPVSQQLKTTAAESGATDNISSSSPGSAEAAKEAFLAAHFRFIRDKIFRNLGYPSIARRMGWAGKVTVAFTVCMDGSVEDISVLETSGFSVLDRNAIETIRKSCPLPKPPMKTALIMPIVYRLE